MGLGALLILASGAAYLLLLHHSGSLFYPFAALVFIAIPLIAAATAAVAAQSRRSQIFFSVSCALFGFAALLFVLTYAVWPEFQRTSVPLPVFCSDSNSGAHPAARLAYDLPGVGATILLTSDQRAAAVVAVDFARAPFPSTAYLVRKSDNRILWSDRFGNDIISAALSDGVLYIYNDKLGYWLDERTGVPVHNFFTIDNYGGLSATDRPIIAARAPTGRWYLETTGVISMWRADGTVLPLRHVTFNSTAFNCFIDGTTGKVSPF
jgi:hypothetical protein